MATGINTITNLATGDVITEAWVDSLYAMFGGDAGGWASYTPTYSGGAIGNGTITGKYIQVNKMVWFQANLTFGNSTTVTGVVTFTLPVTAASTNCSQQFQAVYFDNSGTAIFPLYAQFASTTTVAGYAIGTAGNYAQWAATSATVPIAYGTSDQIQFAGWYLAA